MKIRERKYQSGNKGWAVDFGIVDGKRVVISCGSKQQAERVLSLGAIDAVTRIEEAKTARSLRARRAATAKAEMQARLAHVSLQRGRREAFAEFFAEIPERLAELQDDLIPLPVFADSYVYFLLLGEEVVYVGQTLSLFQRMADHRGLGRIEFDRVLILPTHPSALNEVEWQWISKLKPKWNSDQIPRQLQRGGYPL